jgi:hypothetical protein
MSDETIDVYQDGVCVLRRLKTDADDVEILEAKKARIAAARYDKEIGGVDTRFGRVSTDRESQTMLSNALTYATLGNKESIPWKFQDGFRTLSRDEFLELVNAVGAHIESCFLEEQEALNALI